MKRTLFLTPLLLLLTACGGGAAAQNGPRDESEKTSEYTVTYRGETLYCVGVRMPYNNAVGTCDYVRFYAENPGLLPDK